MRKQGGPITRINRKFVDVKCTLYAGSSLNLFLSLPTRFVGIVLGYVCVRFLSIIVISTSVRSKRNVLNIPRITIYGSRSVLVIISLLTKLLEKEKTTRIIRVYEDYSFIH